MGRLPHWIRGREVGADGTEWAPVYNPATGDVLAEVCLDDPRALSQATEAAAAAYLAWAATPVMQRARVFFRYRDLLEQHRSRLAHSVTTEHGKTLDDAYAEVGRGIEVVELATAAPSLLQGGGLANVARGIDTALVRYPLGVVAGITPFNFPAMIPLWMVPLALVAGNTFILKPSERTPHTAMLLAQLLHEAGLPDGALNVVHGGRAMVDGLIRHPVVRAVSFVGSQPVAEHVYQTAAHHGKRVQALGGAKNFHVVMPDALLDATVAALMGSAFGAAGERCLAASVVLAVGGVADPLVERLGAAVDELRVGPGDDPDTVMGPLIRGEHRDKVLRYIDSGEREGAVLVRDGRCARLPDRGFFLGATIFDYVTEAMTIAREEIFGPVLSVVRVSDLAEAIAVANRSRFGNTASIYTASGQAAQYFRDRIEVGMVGVNIGVAAPVAVFPFSGWKDSFYGDLHATGRDGYEFYTEKKVITTRWPG